MSLKLLYLARKETGKNCGCFFDVSSNGSALCAKCKRVTARNNVTLMYGFIRTYVKVAEGCKERCARENINRQCSEYDMSVSATGNYRHSG